MQKEQLRLQLKARRSQFTDAEVDAGSEAITRNLINSVSWTQIKNLHVYDSIDSLKEVRTKRLIEFLKTRPGIQVTMAKKLRAPIGSKIKFDLIVVPTLAFDTQGYRLGMGGGWYDSFLATQPQALKIGLAYSQFKVNKLAFEKHDIKLDQVITEDGPAF